MSMLLRYNICNYKKLFMPRINIKKCNIALVMCAEKKNDYMSFSRPFCTSKEQNHIQSDVVELYSGPLAGQIRTLKMFTLFTSVMGLAAQPLFYLKMMETDNMPGMMGMFAVIGIFALGTPLFIHTITKKYVIDLKYNVKTEEYTATTYNIFASKSEIKFKADDVVIPDISGMFHSVTVKGRPLFVDERFFSNAEDYKKLLGYDKPLDLKLNLQANLNVVSHDNKDVDKKK